MPGTSVRVATGSLLATDFGPDEAIVGTTTEGIGALCGATVVEPKMNVLATTPLKLPVGPGVTLPKIPSFTSTVMPALLRMVPFVSTIDVPLTVWRACAA